jgi:hypothetical protein
LFGASFELPVVVMVFVKLGLLTYETMSRTRSYAIVAIFVAAAVLTPTPDIPTMLLMAMPMLILYEICIWLAWMDRRKNRMAEEQEARERAEAYALSDETPSASWQTPDVPPVEEDFYKDPYADVSDEAGDDGWTADAPVHDLHDDTVIEDKKLDAGEKEEKRPDQEP